MPLTYLLTPTVGDRSSKFAIILSAIVTTPCYVYAVKWMTPQEVSEPLGPVTPYAFTAQSKLQNSDR